MKDLDNLLSILACADYKVRFLKAKASATCIACGKDAVGFSSYSEILEYSISALCQDCQNQYFSNRGDRPAIQQNNLKKEVMHRHF